MTKARTVLAFLVALFALLTLLDRFVLVELLVRRTGLAFLVACVEALAIVAVGSGARLWRAPAPGRAEGAHHSTIDWPVDFLVGYPIFGALCFLVGLVRINAITMGALLVIGALALGRRGYEGWGMRHESRNSNQSSSLIPHPSSLFLGVAAILACGFVAAQAPPVTLDELAYHVAVPWQWTLEGRAVELPLSSHSYFPLGIESADLPLFAILGQVRGGIASHFLHLLAAIATIAVIARRTQSWLVTAAIATTPALAITAGWSLVDWPLAGLFVVLFVALESDDVDTASAATAAGLLVKYTFLPFALIAWLLARKRPRWPVLIGLLFFVRNLVLTGNPVMPFFSADAPHVAGFRELALADYIFDGAFIDESLGASLLALAVFASGRIALASLACGVALIFLAPSARILVPYFAVAAMSAAPALRKRLFSALIGLAIVIQTFLVIWMTGRSNAFSLLAAATTDEQYVAGARPASHAIVWLNATLPPGSRTLVVGAGETFWLERRARGGGNLDGARMSRYLDLQTPEALRARLRGDGITHVAVVNVAPPTNVAIKREERQTTLSATAQRMLAIMLDRYTATLASRPDVTLFELR